MANSHKPASMRSVSCTRPITTSGSILPTIRSSELTGVLISLSS
jgi:hypothetical protein